MFGKFTRLSPADFVPMAQSVGIPIVRAMKEYQRDTGKMPGRIEDLIPRYLPYIPNHYAIMVESGDFGLLVQHNELISYDFTSGAEGWSVRGPFVNGPIPLPPVTLGPGANPAQAQ